MAKFSQLNIQENLLNAVKSIGFEDMTQVQEKVIPLALKSKNLIVVSQTGTGKTHSFLIPIINNIFAENKIQYIILCPTRELARQVWDEAKKLQKFSSNNSNIQLAVGGTDKQSSFNKYIKNTPDMIIGTPGRINDIFIKNDAFNMKHVKALVIDEADMVFDLGFSEEVRSITSSLKKACFQLFSATIPKVLKDYIKKFVKDINVIEIQNASYNNKNVEHHLLNTKHKERLDLLTRIIEIQKPYLAIVFVNNKDEVEKMVSKIKIINKSVVGLHGKLEARIRKNIINNVKEKKFNILVSTDIAARGIDIKDVSHVYSVQVPFDPEYYVHRAGRTGRAGKTGFSYLLYSTDDSKAINKISSYNISFKHSEIKENKVVEKKIRIPKFGNKTKSEEDTGVLAVIALTKSKMKKKGVKPGYRKKMKKEIQKIKRKKVRAAIKENIKQIKKQKAKEKQSKLKLIIK